MIATRTSKRGTIEIYPKFIMDKSVDLMIRGGDFYAIWREDIGLWSTDEQDAIYLIDKELDTFAKENADRFDTKVRVLHLWDAETGMIDTWHKYCQRQRRDSFVMLDEKLVFSNTKTTKNDYASKRLNYPLEEGEIVAYDKLMSTLYSEKERHKIEWAIGSIVCGDSKKLQKFMVLYGAAGTGKSTVLNIIQQLFEGYYSVFDAKALGSSNNSFALEAFKSNPLVSIQHDGDLSKIEDNTRLNSLVSHETMSINEKFKSAYAGQFKCFLFMGTNKPVKITDAKSGLMRRLIDVSPSGKKLGIKEYKHLVSQVDFELGAIAYHCQKVYLSNRGAYDDYVPMAMLGASNDFYNFMLEVYPIFQKENRTTLKASWEMYKTYCEDAKVPFPFSQRIFKEELKNYFKEYQERFILDDGARIRSYYTEFRKEKFDVEEHDVVDEKPIVPRLTLEDNIISNLDILCAEEFAQYAKVDETPRKAWDTVKTKLKDLDTSNLHFILLPENHIFIDFDIKDESGNKCLEKNLEEAAKWPPTYAELSKSGLGVHLHYIYTGDVTKLSSVYDKDIEIKVPTGKSSLRRKLTKCNGLPIAKISSGLPLKGETKVLDVKSIRSEEALRALIVRNLNKEIHSSTTPSINFIKKILDDAYNDGLKYDVRDMYHDLFMFALNSTHQSETCLKVLKEMKLQSAEMSIPVVEEERPMVFFDVEVFPNLFIVCWKIAGPDKQVMRMINPKSTQIAELIENRLIGFNNIRYDNYILYACLIGYTNEQLYNLSQKIINTDDKNPMSREAINISYTDVYDFASAQNKMSLKKYEILLGIPHKEVGIPWDKPVPEDLWEMVASYCDNDVLATEKVFEYLADDWLARQILADLAGMTVNDTTNNLTMRFIFGTNRKPQNHFNYRDMGDMTYAVNFVNEYTVFDSQGMPIFPGYKYENGKSTYRGEVVGEGGEVYAETGMYGDVIVQDVASMHPSSIIAENLLGDTYTARFKELYDTRIAIKHKEFDRAKEMFGGALVKYLTDEKSAKGLSNAFKTALNSAYGLTAAHFDNAFRDIRNVDNIVAKRGALFMINLKYEIQDRGFKVIHIKTDSIKIPNATPEIIAFCSEYGKMYGYTFEHEATYDKICLVNDAVYIAKYASQEKCQKLYGYVPDKNRKEANTWSATGTQFAVPYVFKTLFTKEPIVFNDLCETKSVTTAIYLDMNEGLPNVEKEEKELAKLITKDVSPEITLRINELMDIIKTGHDYRFVGRVGLFCPIKPGFGGGTLLRQAVDKNGNIKYGAISGSTGYRWVEADTAKNLNLENQIDRSYFENMVEEAINSIKNYGLVNWFTSDKPYNIEDNDILPF